MSIRQCVQAIANDRKDLASARADLERVLKKELTAIRQTEKRQQKKKKPQNQSTHEGLPLWAVPANVEMAFEKSSPDELGYADANLVLRKMKILSPMTEEDEETVMEYVNGKASTDGRIQLPEMLACVVAAAKADGGRGRKKSEVFQRASVLFDFGANNLFGTERSEEWDGRDDGSTT